MFVVYDLETTGLSEFNCDVIQFAYVLFDDYRHFVRAETMYFYYEGMSWSQEAADKSHHLSLDFLRGFKDEFRKNIVRMWTVLSGSIVVGHNNRSFDDPFAANWLARMGLPGLQFSQSYDTMADLKSWYKRRAIKLDPAFREFVGYTPEQVNTLAGMWFKDNESVMRAHNAAYDVTLTAMITIKALQKGYFNFDVRRQSLQVSDIRDPYDNQLTVDLLDSHKAVFCKCFKEDGSVIFINTSNCLKELDSLEYSAQPDYRVLGFDFRQVNGYWVYHDDNKVLTLRREPNTVYLEICANGVKLSSNDIATDKFAENNS